MPPTRLVLYVVRHMVEREALAEPDLRDMRVVLMDPSQAPQCAALIYHQHNTDANTDQYETVGQKQHMCMDFVETALLDIFEALGQSLVRKWGMGPWSDVPDISVKVEKKEDVCMTDMVGVKDEGKGAKV